MTRFIYTLTKFFAIAVIGVLASCSVIKQNNYEKMTKAFMTQFEANLAASDEVILKQFRIDKRDKVILKAIQVMQNKELMVDSIKCTVNFAKPQFTFMENETIVDMIAIHQSIDSANPMQRESKFTLWLSVDDEGTVFISKFEADEFFTDYKSLAYELKSKKDEARDIANRQTFFNKAEQIKLLYDSVIWYTTFQDSVYFYVVNGQWTNYFLGKDKPRSESYEMGLVSETGRVVVPPQFDLIGTIGFETPGVIEVKKDGLVGHYRMDGVVLVPAEFEWIVPYTLRDSLGTERQISLVKKGTNHGWIDSTYHVGFVTPAAEKYVREFAYLNHPVKIDSKTTTMTEILALDYMGYGIVIPPAYLVKSNVLQEIITSLFTGYNSLGYGGLESVETESSFFVKITENISAFMVVLTEKYVEGREGFYKHANLTFVDDNNKQINLQILRTGVTTFHRIDSSLLEIRIASSTDMDGYDYEYEGMEADWNPTFFQYFKLSDGSVTLLESKRSYNFTEFAMLDSSYFSGEFAYWHPENGKSIRYFRSEKDLREIRNEILAIYGYAFNDPELHTYWSRRHWYDPRYSKYSDFIELMKEKDKHNLLFLETLVGSLDSEPAT